MLLDNNIVLRIANKLHYYELQFTDTRHMIEVHCTSCEKSFKLKKYHKLSCRKCNTIYRYRCLKCAEECTTLHKLRLHMKSEHLLLAHQSEEGIMQECDQCGKQFNCRESLMKHRRVSCLNSTILHCEQCHFATKYKHSIARHINIRHSTWKKLV